MLRAVDPDLFEQAADGYHAVSSAASEGKDRLHHQIVAQAFPGPDPDSPSGDGDGLVGEGAVAARQRLTRLAENYHYAQVECGLIRAALNGFAAELRPVKKKLDTAIEEAKAAKFTVEPDGSITYPAAGRTTEGGTPQGGTASGHTDTTATGVSRQAAGLNPNPHAALAQDCANRIAAAVQEATEIDQRWAPKLRRLKAQNDLTLSSKDWADVHGDQRAVQRIAGGYLAKGDIPNGKSPAENAAWWKGLNEQQKADYVSLYPASIGALDGLPSDIRDEANRAVLAEKKGYYQAMLDDIPPEPRKIRGPGLSLTPQWVEWNERYGKERHDRLNEALSGMRAIEERFDRTGQDGLPEAYLLEFDLKGEGYGRVAIANGNPDTADHTGVYVPGTGGSLPSVDGDIKRGEALWRTSSTLSPDSDVSTITWLDYKAPPDIPHAASGDYATAGGPRLNDFLHSTATAQGGTDASHTTVIGHSYGSTTIGEASHQGDLQADDIIAVGSPGMQARHADELDVGAKHMWSMRAEDDDAVAVGGRISGLGEDRIIPADEEFGGNIMQSDTSGHSGYWDSREVEPSTSLKNQGRVIVGDYEGVELE